MAALAALAVFLLVVAAGMQGNEGVLLPHPASPGKGARPIPSGARSGPTRRLTIIIGSLLTAFASYTIFKSIPITVAAAAAAALVPWAQERRRDRRRRDTLAIQFKEALTAIAGSLRASASLHTAFERALEDLQRLYPDGREPIVHEVGELVRQLRLGVPVETALAEWERRLDLEAVSDFVSATLAVRTRGGNLAEVMNTVAESVTWKVTAQAQIRAITAEKRSEAQMLIAAPLFALGALWLFSPDYIRPLFTTTAGQVILFIGLICNLFAFLAVRKVLDSAL